LIYIIIFFGALCAWQWWEGRRPVVVEKYMSAKGAPKRPREETDSVKQKQKASGGGGKKKKGRVGEGA
jgi:hypothetical protein